jgi:hypothetical protein
VHDRALEDPDTAAASPHATWSRSTYFSDRVVSAGMVGGDMHSQDRCVLDGVADLPAPEVTPSRLGLMSTAAPSCSIRGPVQCFREKTRSGQGCSVTDIG